MPSPRSAPTAPRCAPHSRTGDPGGQGRELWSRNHCPCGSEIPAGRLSWWEYPHKTTLTLTKFNCIFRCAFPRQFILCVYVLSQVFDAFRL